MASGGYVRGRKASDCRVDCHHRFNFARASDNCMPIANGRRSELTLVEATRKYLSGHSWRNPLRSESLRKDSSHLRAVDFGRLDIVPKYSMLPASVSLWGFSRFINVSSSSLCFTIPP